MHAAGIPERQGAGDDRGGERDRSERDVETCEPAGVRERDEAAESDLQDEDDECRPRRGEQRRPVAVAERRGDGNAERESERAEDGSLVRAPPFSGRDDDRSPGGCRERREAEPGPRREMRAGH
jgi:hypothetical protein